MTNSLLVGIQVPSTIPTPTVQFNCTIAFKLMSVARDAIGKRLAANSAGMILCRLRGLDVAGHFMPIAHLRALLKIRLHFLHVSAVATVRSPCLGAAQRRLCLPNCCCRPMLAKASAGSFPGIWECPLTHLKLRGRCLFTSWYRVCARAASS